jgi:hypothetical protein
MNPEASTTRKSSSRLVIAASMILLLTCALVFTAIFLFTTWISPDRQIAAIHARDPVFNLELTTPNANIQVLEATQEILLQGYSWIDQDARIARIPIARAMELIVTEQAAQTATAQP